MKDLEQYRFTEDHEWALLQEKKVRLGISDYAQSELGDVVFVEIPQVGKTVQKGEVISNIESIKAVSEIYAPVSGKIVAVNEALTEKPELINQDPYQEAWIAEIEASDLAELEQLRNCAEYQSYVAEISK